MRVLVVTAPFTAHTYPLVPLAWELRTAGHEVMLATAGEALRAAGSGLPTADIARGFDLRRTTRRLALRNPLLAHSERAGRAGVRAVATLVGEINDELADGAVAFGDQWRPDLVVYGSLAPVGALVADRCQVPAVLCDHTLLDGEQLSGTTGHLSYASGRHNLPAPAAPAAAIRIAPASMVGARSGWPMRYVAYDNGQVAPDWLDRSHPPRIAVVRSSPHDSAGPLARAVVAAAPTDLEIVLVRPDLGAGPALPPHVRAVEWTALSRLLPTCAGLVHHGGTDTVLTALQYGVPQLLVPDSGEHRHNAALVRSRGAGWVVGHRNLSAGLLRRLIDADDLLAASHDVRVEMAAAPGPPEVVTRLGNLARSGNR
jgi:UDP:flavonoid glycosyltransferase YjiC (YdhE family)